MVSAPARVVNAKAIGENHSGIGLSLALSAVLMSELPLTAVNEGGLRLRSVSGARSQPPDLGERHVAGAIATSDDVGGDLALK